MAPWPMSCNAFRRVVSANFWNVLVETRLAKSRTSLRNLTTFTLDAVFQFNLIVFGRILRESRKVTMIFFFFFVDEMKGSNVSVYFLTSNYRLGISMTMIIYIRRLKFRLFDFFRRILTSYAGTHVENFLFQNCNISSVLSIIINI